MMSNEYNEHELLPVLVRIARGLEIANSIAAATGNLQEEDLLEEVRISWLAGAPDSLSAENASENADKPESGSESAKDKPPKLKILNMDTSETLEFAQAFIAELTESDGGDETGPLSQAFIGKVVAAQVAIGTANLSSMTKEQNKLMSPALQKDIFNYRNKEDDSFEELVALAATKPKTQKLS